MRVREVHIPLASPLQCPPVDASAATGKSRDLLVSEAATRVFAGIDIPTGAIVSYKDCGFASRLLSRTGDGRLSLTGITTFPGSLTWTLLIIAFVFSVLVTFVFLAVSHTVAQKVRGGLRESLKDAAGALLQGRSVTVLADFFFGHSADRVTVKVHHVLPFPQV